MDNDNHLGGGYPSDYRIGIRDSAIFKYLQRRDEFLTEYLDSHENGRKIIFQ